jgi:putative transposase
LRGDIRDFVEECFNEIAVSNECEIDVMEIAEDHVDIFLGFPPRYSISEIVQKLKGVCKRDI